MKKSQIRKNLEISTTTMINIYETLWESELIKILPNPKRQYFILTKKGEKIALLLKKVQDLITDNMKMSEKELTFLKNMIENDLENKLK
jgi:predicted transcriptional regulator